MAEHGTASTRATDPRTTDGATRTVEAADQGSADTTGDHRFTARPSSAGPLVFALCFLLLVAGFWLMAVSFDQESGVTFMAGLATASVAFLIPLARADSQ